MVTNDNGFDGWLVEFEFVFAAILIGSEIVVNLICDWKRESVVTDGMVVVEINPTGGFNSDCFE